MITKHDIAHKALTETLTRDDVTEYYGNYEFDREYLHIPGKATTHMFNECIYLQGLFNFITKIMKDNKN